MSDIRRTAMELATLAKTINQQSDALNGYLRDIEASINALHIGISVTVSVPYGFLCYGKINRAWRIGWGANDNQNVVPLVDAPREVRIHCVDKLPMLLEELTKRAEEMTEEVKKSLGTLNPIISQLKSKEERNG